MFDEINNVDGTLILILDEVDHIKDDSLLYKLSRAHEDGDIIDTFFGVVGISNDLRYRENLSSKVQSSLCEKVVSFSAYDADELVEVLSQRTQVAFHEDAVGQDVISLCAAYGARNSGDARKALDLLLESGDIARSSDSDTVEIEHVEQAKDRLETDQLLEGVKKYSTHGKLTLLALITLAEDKKTPCRSRSIHKRYVKICEKEVCEPVSNRAVRDYLSELEVLGITSSETFNDGKDGGKYKKHQLRRSVSEIQGALTESLTADL
jgi:cell division control protein 6